jgi:hypothetical protein
MKLAQEHVGLPTQRGFSSNYLVDCQTRSRARTLTRSLSRDHFFAGSAENLRAV